MVTNRQFTKTTYMALCGLFAAMMAICSLISIPLGFTPVPVNLATLGMFLAGGLLGKKHGTIAIAVFVLVGAVGIPVFSEFRGGFSVLAGPTGGYIIGYILGAFLVGLLIEKLLAGRSPRPVEGMTRTRELLSCAAAMVAGLIACYLLGAIWFIFTTHTGIWAALISCVFPFLPGDALKIIAGAILVQKLRHLL